MFPGTLLDRSFDPRSQSWYLNALSSPGKVVVSPPYLDPGGAGYIVTVSHTVYQVIVYLCALTVSDAAFEKEEAMCEAPHVHFALY